MSSSGRSSASPARMLMRSTTCAEMSDMNAMVIGSRSQNRVSLSGARW